MPPKPTHEEAIIVRNSKVHGKGVFARQAITKGTRLIEYTGEIITWKQALKRHPHDPNDPHHTFYFHIDESHVIDAKFGGNDSRWVNHSCAPNCEAEQKKNRIYIRALREIAKGEELNYDYGLTIDEPFSEALVRDYPCRCGSENCMGTLLHFDVEPAMTAKKKKKKVEKKAENKAEKKAENKAEKKAEKKPEKDVDKKTEKKIEKKTLKKLEKKADKKDSKKAVKTVDNKADAKVAKKAENQPVKK